MPNLARNGNRLNLPRHVQDFAVFGELLDAETGAVQQVVAISGQLLPALEQLFL